MINFARRVGFTYSFAAVVAATACGSVATPAAPRAANTDGAASYKRIVVLGDSLAVSPSGSENFPTELQKRITGRSLQWTITNAAIGGHTTADGVRRLDDVLTDDTRILILELGANDGLRGINIPTVEKNLSSIIERAQERGVRVLLCGMETPPMNGWQYTLEFHNLFPRLAASYDVPLVPFLLAGVALNPEFNGADEIHPNALGARRIAETVWPFVEALVQQEESAAVLPR
jgi:acyl-CoA thioesterase I